MSGKLMLSSPTNRKGIRPVRLSKLWPAGSTKLPGGAGVDYVSLFCYLSLFSCQWETKIVKFSISSIPIRLYLVLVD